MFIERLQVKGLLSFGPDGIDLPLEPLNVIIGPNGSGKSNLLTVLGLLRTAAGGHDRLLGGRDWGKLLWQGPPCIEPDAPTRAMVAATATIPEWEESLTYSLQIFEGIQIKESVDLADNPQGDKVGPHERDALDWLRRKFGRIRLYNNWEYGELAAIRKGQGHSDIPNSDGPRLTETAGNLPGLISRFSSERKDALTKGLHRLYDGVVAIHTPFDDNKMSVVIEESGGRRIPAERLSDGTLRYLSLLTVLLDPHPSPLIGIEEPELGLHPDMVFGLASLLVEASERTQLVVTTHSPTLIDALTDHASSVVACDKYDGQTRFRRVNPEDLASWIGDRGLGEVWADGGIGGNRW